MLKCGPHTHNSGGAAPTCLVVLNMCCGCATSRVQVVAAFRQILTLHWHHHRLSPCPTTLHTCTSLPLSFPHSLCRPPSTGSMQNGSIYKFVSLILGNSCYNISSEKAERRTKKNRLNCREMRLEFIAHILHNFAIPRRSWDLKSWSKSLHV